MLTGRQIREARALLAWRSETLSSRTALPLGVIDRAEAVDGDPDITLSQAIVIRHALVVAGVEFGHDGPKLRSTAG